MARTAAGLISAPIRECHARLGVAGTLGIEFTIAHVRAHDQQVTVSGPNRDGDNTLVEFPISCPLSEIDGGWEVATESGPLVITRC